MILDPSHSLAVQLNFRNFRKFRNKCFAVFRHVSQIMFRKFRKYEFRNVSQILLLQLYICFASFARFRKYEFRKLKVSQFSVSKEFASRFFVTQVSQGYRNRHWAVC